MSISNETKQRAARVRLIAMDVDGVLTDGTLPLFENDEGKFFYARDGLGISVGRSAGLKFAIITGRRCEAVRKRAGELRIHHLVQAATNKAKALSDVCAAEGIDVTAAAFIGDDWNDLPGMEVAGLSACPADAPPEIRARVDVVLEHNGGRGAVRELVESVLEAQGGWEKAAEKWLESLREREAQDGGIVCRQ